VVGFEEEGMEVWVYPFKYIAPFTPLFKLRDKGLLNRLSRIAELRVFRLESTIIVYSHPAFTVRRLSLSP